MIQGHLSTTHGCWLAYSDMTFCGVFIPRSRWISYPQPRPSHSASMHSSLVTTNLVLCVLTARCQHSMQLDNQPAMHATAQSTARPFSHSSPDSNILDNGPTCSLLLSPTMIWSNLGDLLPFLRAGGLALIFTSRLVLLVEDNSNDSTVLSEQQSQLTSYQRPKVGQSEKEREWSTRSQSSYYGYSSVQRNITGSPATITVTALASHPSARCFQNGYLVRWSYQPSYICAPRPPISLTLDLIAVPPSLMSPLPTQAP